MKATIIAVALIIALAAVLVAWMVTRPDPAGACAERGGVWSGVTCLGD